MKQEMTKHLCCVSPRYDGTKILAWYEIEAIDWYYARHQAADRFRKDHSEIESTVDWVVDSIEV